MNWEDEGYLLSKRKFRENANIINVFTSLYGNMSGIVYGGNSRKIRNFLQIGNKIFIAHNSKSTNRLGYFKTELIEPISPKYFNDKKRTSCIIASTSLLNLLLPESQCYKKIYSSLTNLFDNFDLDNWIIIYIYWEINLIKELGFSVDLNNIINFKKKNDNIIETKIDNIMYQIPNFLITKKIPQKISNELITKSLAFTRNVFLNKFFMPNNLIFPKSRVRLESYFI